MDVAKQFTWIVLVSAFRNFNSQTHQCLSLGPASSYGGLQTSAAHTQCMSPLRRAYPRLYTTYYILYTTHILPSTALVRADHGMSECQLVKLASLPAQAVLLGYLAHSTLFRPPWVPGSSSRPRCSLPQATAVALHVAHHDRPTGHTAVGV